MDEPGPPRANMECSSAGPGPILEGQSQAQGLRQTGGWRPKPGIPQGGTAPPWGAGRLGLGSGPLNILQCCHLHLVLSVPPLSLWA